MNYVYLCFWILSLWSKSTRFNNSQKVLDLLSLELHTPKFVTNFKIYGTVPQQKKKIEKNIFFFLIKCKISCFDLKIPLTQLKQTDKYADAKLILQYNVLLIWFRKCWQFCIVTYFPHENYKLDTNNNH